MKFRVMLTAAGVVVGLGNAAYAVLNDSDARDLRALAEAWVGSPALIERHVERATLHCLNMRTSFAVPDPLVALTADTVLLSVRDELDLASPADAAALSEIHAKDVRRSVAALSPERSAEMLDVLGALSEDYSIEGCVARAVAGWIGARARSARVDAPDRPHPFAG